MASRSGLAVVAVLLGGGVLAVVVGTAPVFGLLRAAPLIDAPTPEPADYENGTVRVLDDGTTRASVHVRIADTPEKRYVGLSETDSLGCNEGMLFVHPSEDTHAYVMRSMSFPLDIVFVAADGTITEIHHAPVEPGASGGELTRYRGRGKWILEVPRGWTTATGVSEDDTVRVPGGAR